MKLSPQLFRYYLLVALHKMYCTYDDWNYCVFLCTTFPLTIRQRSQTNLLNPDWNIYNTSHTVRRRVCHDRGRNYIITRARGGGGRRRGASLSETRVTSQGEETTKLHLALGYTPLKSECNRDEVAYQPLLAYSVKYTLLSMLSARCSIHLRGKWNYKRIPPPPVDAADTFYARFTRAHVKPNDHGGVMFARSSTIPRSRQIARRPRIKYRYFSNERWNSMELWGIVGKWKMIVHVLTLLEFWRTKWFDWNSNQSCK